MTSSTANAPLPFPGYEKLDGKRIAREMSAHSQVELEAVERYERAHQSRAAVLDKLRFMRRDEPLAGYDGLGVEEIVAALRESDLTTIKKVRGYERIFRSRSAVLEEVIRLHHQLRSAQPATSPPAYQPLSATTPKHAPAEA